MKIKVRNVDYSILENRVKLANYLSNMFDISDEVPYQPNKGDDTYWTLDLGNDWKLDFRQDSDGDSVDTFHVRYRYQCEKNQYEQGFLGWLKIRMYNVEEVE